MNHEWNTVNRGVHTLEDIASDGPALLAEIGAAIDALPELSRLALVTAIDEKHYSMMALYLEDGFNRLNSKP